MMQPSATSGAPVRRARYQDVGCELHPACLSCPLFRCRFDIPTDREAEVSERNAAIMRAIWDEDLDVAELMVRFRVSRPALRRLVLELLVTQQPPTPAPATRPHLVLIRGGEP
ncbi:MAG: hypothetical protein NTZ05_23500 [Chloroflexi bacterium]|nr:hypothetical protein [Chloroflexota bacterium]